MLVKLEPCYVHSVPKSPKRRIMVTQAMFPNYVNFNTNEKQIPYYIENENFFIICWTGSLKNANIFVNFLEILFKNAKILLTFRIPIS